MAEGHPRCRRGGGGPGAERRCIGGGEMAMRAAFRYLVRGKLQGGVATGVVKGGEGYGGERVKGWNRI